MQDLERKEHLCAQTACLSSIEGKHPGTKVSSINREAGFRHCAEIQMENLQYSFPPQGPPPTTGCHMCLPRPSPTAIDWVFRVLSHSVYYSLAALKAWLDTQTKLSLKLPLSLPVIWKRPECWSHPSHPEGALVSRERERDWDKERERARERERMDGWLGGKWKMRKMMETGTEDKFSHFKEIALHFRLSLMQPSWGGKPPWEKNMSFHGKALVIHIDPLRLKQEQQFRTAKCRLIDGRQCKKTGSREREAFSNRSGADWRPSAGMKPIDELTGRHFNL